MISWCKRNKGVSSFIAAVLTVVGWIGFEPIRDYFIGEELEQAEQSAQIAVYQRFDAHSGVVGHVEVGNGVKLTYLTCELPSEVPNNAYFITYRINGVPVDFRLPSEGYADTSWATQERCDNPWTGSHVFEAGEGDLIEVVWHFPIYIEERLIGNYQVVMSYVVY